MDIRCSEGKRGGAGWGYPAGLLIFGMAYYLSFFNYGINLFDEGFWVEGARRALQGQLPISDFTSYPPGGYFLLAFFFKLFGVHLWVSRFTEVALLLADGLLVFHIGRRLMPDRFALIPSLILILFPGPWFKVSLTFGTLLSLFFLLRFMEHRTTARALAVGWVTGIAFMLRFEAALFSFLTVWIVLFLDHLRQDGNWVVNKKAASGFLKDILVCLLGSLMVISPFIFYYLSETDLVRLLYLVKAQYGDAMATAGGFFGRPSVEDLFTKFHIRSLKNLFFFLILFLYTYVTIRVFFDIVGQKRKDFPCLLPILVMGILSLAYPYFSFTKFHLLQVAAPAYIFFGLVVHSSVQKKGMKSKLVLGVLVLVLGLFFLDNLKMKAYFESGSISRLHAIRKEDGQPLSTARGRIHLGRRQFNTVQALIQCFQGEKGYLMSLDFDPMVNFLVGLENPTRFTILLPFFLKNVQNQKEVIGEIEKHRIDYLLLNKGTWTGREGQSGFHHDYPVLYEFVVKRYDSGKETGDYLIFSRKRG